MAPRASQISSLLQATHRLSLASPAGPVPSSQRSASWSLSSIRAALLPKGKTTSPIEDAAAAREQTKQQKAQALTVEQPKGLFDAALEDSEVQEVAQALQPKLKAATFVRVCLFELFLRLPRSSNRSLTLSALAESSTSRPPQISRRPVGSSMISVG